MVIAHLIKEIGRGERGASDLDEADARKLFGTMLDGGVPELELGAILIGLRMKGEAIAELSGLDRKS